MAILGLLLLAAATALGVEFASSNTSTVVFEVFGYAYIAPLATVVMFGAIAGAVALFGLSMTVASVRRRRLQRTVARHRVRVEDLQQRLTEVEQTIAGAVAENDRLRAELAARELAEATMGGVAVPPGAGQVPYGDQVTAAVRSEILDLTDTGPREPYPAEVGRARAHNHAAEGAEKASVLGKFRGMP